MCHLSELPRLASRMHVIVIYNFDFWVETGVPVLDDIYIRPRGAHVYIYIRPRGAHVSESFIYS